MIKFLDLKRVTELHGNEIQEAARQVIESGWYLQGEVTHRFEQHYAEYIGTEHCVGVANGLDALTLIYRAYMEMGVMQEGDEVIVPANTYIASILAITENGLIPVLVEPRMDTLEIDDSLIETHITERTRSIMCICMAVVLIPRASRPSARNIISNWWKTTHRHMGAGFKFQVPGFRFQVL